MKLKIQKVPLLVFKGTFSHYGMGVVMWGGMKHISYHLQRPFCAHYSLSPIQFLINNFLFTV